MKINKILLVGLTLTAAVSLNSCIGDGDDTIILEDGKSATDIPDDSRAKPNPDLDGLSNLIIPNFNFTNLDEDGNSVLRFDMTGVQHPDTHEWLKLYGTDNKDQNFWVEVDDLPKGVVVYNSSDDDDQRVVPIDLIFTVDNSGSMSEEADVIAREIYDWAVKLRKAGLDIRFACVGYDVNGAISGALSFTDEGGLYSYLNRYGVSGTDRTVGFVGSDYEVSLFKTKAPAYKCPNECGMAAIRFADELFTFRKNANRIYVNFTDEPNQNGSIYRYDVESLLTDWDASRGTIHTVYSGGSDTNNYLMSRYTGGTVLNASPTFNNVSLESLPVTDAMRNSYIIRMASSNNYLDGLYHKVRMTILSKDGSIGAERSFRVMFGLPSDVVSGSSSGSGSIFNGGFGTRK